MRRPGILGTLRLAAVLAIAAPLLLFGVDWLLAGRPVYGGGFIVLALVMLGLQQWLTNPFDPADIAESVADRLTDREE